MDNGASQTHMTLSKEMGSMIDEILRHLQTHGTCDRDELTVVLDTTERHVALALHFLAKYRLVDRDFLGVRLAPATLHFLRDLDAA
jgi:hypothetical protein